TIRTTARHLWLLLASAGLVLLVACANVADLFLVRAAARQRHVAVRRPRGARRPRTARDVLPDEQPSPPPGTGLRVDLGWNAGPVLGASGPATLPRLQEIRLDGVVVAYSLGLGLVSALMFGAIPLWRLNQGTSSLHENGRGNTASVRRHRVRHVLMGTQVAM